MNSFKQALMHFKNTMKKSLLLGVAAAMFIISVNHLPLINAFVISFGFLVFQALAQKLIEKKAELPLTVKNLASYIVTSIILLPAGILLGSAIGILQSPQDLYTTIPLALGLIIIVLYFYFLFSQALRHHLESKTNLGKSIDIIALASVKNFRLYISLSVYFSILIIISELLKEIGLIITLPLLFYANHFAYLETSKTLSLKKDNTDFVF